MNQVTEHAVAVESGAKRLRKAGYLTLADSLGKTAAFIRALPPAGGIIMVPAQSAEVAQLRMAAVIGFVLGAFVMWAAL